MSKRNKHLLYRLIEPAVFAMKIALQMLIGLTLAAYLCLFFFDFVVNLFDQNWSVVDDFSSELPLAIVGYGLAISAGIELAYMLFTDGPDEALDPLILGLSATSLIVLSHISIGSWENAITLLVLVLGRTP